MNWLATQDGKPVDCTHREGRKPATGDGFQAGYSHFCKLTGEHCKAFEVLDQTCHMHGFTFKAGNFNGVKALACPEFKCPEVNGNETNLIVSNDQRVIERLRAVFA